MGLKNEILNVAIKHAAEADHGELFRQPIIGVSAANDPLYAELKQIIGPEHLYPHDILPGAKTVISFFIPFSEHVVTSNREPGPPSREWAQSYVEGNKLINNISQKIIADLASKGIEAATIPATHTYDESTLKATWSHKSAAYIAGLGSFGVNRLLITKLGCAGRFGSVIIAHEIEADPRSKKELCVYYENGSCLQCIDVCPVDALTTDDFNRFKCHAQLLENSTLFTDLGRCDVCGKCVVVGPCAFHKA